jgi:hypothetical protein
MATKDWTKASQYIEQVAREEHRSAEDVFRDMQDAYKRQQFRASLQRMQAIGEPIARKLGLQTEDDIERYAG